MDIRHIHRARPARALPTARRRRAVRHRARSGRAQDRRLVRPLQHHVQLPDQPRRHAERGVDGGGRAVVSGRGGGRIFWHHRSLLFYLIMATLGVDYGIPGQVATRAVYGLRGAKLIPSLLRVVVSIYWFSFQTLVGASAIVAVLAKMTGITYSLVWVSVIFGLIQASVAV